MMVQKLFVLLKWRPIRLQRYYSLTIQHYYRFQREIVEIKTKRQYCYTILVSDRPYMQNT